MALYMPLELYDAIVAELADDIPALRACALVCRGMLPLARKHLFADVRLGKDAAAACRRLASLLWPCPRVNAYVRSIYIDDVPEGDAIIGRRWVVDEPALAYVLHCVPAARAFVLTSRSLPFPAHLVTPLASLFSSTSLTVIHLAGVRDIPVELFDRCEALRDLRLSGMGSIAFDRTSGLSPRPRGRPARLESLALCVGTCSWTTYSCFDILVSWLTHPQAPFDLSTVKRFSLQMWGTVDFVLAQRLLDAVSPSLEYLALDTSDLRSFGYTQNILNLSRLPHLRHLVLSLPITEEEEPDDGKFHPMGPLAPLAWMDTLLQTFALAPAAALGTLTVILRLEDQELDYTDVIMHDIWARICGLLARERFPALRKVDFELSSADDDADEGALAQVTHHVNDKFASLLPRGVRLRVTEDFEDPFDEMSPLWRRVSLA
ncbi:hypothetical protein EV121DRAFT_257513 [Schizophyllum commune]